MGELIMGTVRKLLTALLALFGTPAAAEVRGDRAAVAASERMLEQVGGRDAWAKVRTFYVEERAFQRTGEIAQLKIWRDFESGSRRLERSTPTTRFAEWLSPNGGFEVRDGVQRPLPAVELAMELQGLRQEPYAIYRRLALRDPTLRLQLRNESSLYIYDGEENLLCWFVLDDTGAPTSWGNFWNGAINQHNYGPLADMGDVRLPKWGSSTTGAFRFEYVLARMSGEAVVPPMR